MQEKVKISPKHVFLHLFSIIMLYATTISLLTLAFQYINVLLPDALADAGFISTYSFDLIRTSLASILVVFPLLILVSVFLNKSYKKDPEVREMKSRRWLIYFTLFAAALIIVVDLTRIIWVFLGGEITLRFILKSVAVLLLTGIIFFYYLQDVRQDKAIPRVKYFVLEVSAMVLLMVVSGFFIVGSPQKERMRRFDDQRISSLQNIQWEIINYWQRKQALPTKLADLNNDISGFMVSQDPQTGEPYEYNVLKKDSFQLCATFDLSSAGQAGAGREPVSVPVGYSQNWDHAAGRVCFDRTVDAQLYPPIKN